MLLAASTDGVYRVDGLREGDGLTTERVLDADGVIRVEQFDALAGVFAAGESGLYHSPDGREWWELPFPTSPVYAVAASPDGDRLYAGTRPSAVFAADSGDGVPTRADAWTEIEGFRALRDRSDWGIPRHDGVSQVRSLCTHPEEPERIVAGVEVGGVNVSDDAGETWTARDVEGFDAPHTDDVHHVAMPDGETLVVSTGSGLYRSTDAGRTWSRLDEGHSQQYFREAFVHDGTVYAGAAPGPSTTWAEDTDHALFESRDGERLEAVSSPTPEEVAIGWCTVDDDVVAVTHAGSLLRRGDGEWRQVGTVPTPNAEAVQYFPLEWYEE